MEGNVINQTNYGTLEVNNNEPDIVEIWMFEHRESNVIQVERENLPKLIELLNQCLDT